MAPTLPESVADAILPAGANLFGRLTRSKSRQKPLISHLQNGHPQNGHQGAHPDNAEKLTPILALQKLVNSSNEAFTAFAQQTPLGREGHALLDATRARIAVIDDRYQLWVHQTIDPLFGRERQEQEKELQGGRELVLNPEQRQANYSLALGAVGIGLAGVSTLLSIPMGLFSVAIGLFIMTPMIKMGYQFAVKQRKFSSLHLMLIYFGGMWLGGYLVIGAAGLIMMAFARKIKMLSESKTRDELSNIFGQQPRSVWILVDGVETEVHMDQIGVGDIMVMDVGQMIPVDGVIVKGAASIDQHMLTGESQPAELGVGDPVLAATVVLSGRIFVRVEKAGAESTARQIGEILNRTARHHLSIEEKAAQMADRSLGMMLAGCGLGFLTGGFTGAAAILGCNFTMSMLGLTPLTMLNFLNQSSRQRILVKDGDALEKLRKVDTYVFDKTGTLTVERPQVIAIHRCAHLSEAEILRRAAAAEHRQTHPIAQAILAAAADAKIAVPKVEDAHYEVGYGIKVKIADDANAEQIRVGSWRFMEMEQIAIPDSMQTLIAQCRDQGHSLVFVAADTELVGAVELKATVRPEARQVLDALRAMGKKLYIISGDQESPTRALAEELGMDGYFANTLPERKAGLVTKLKEEGRTVCFIGDGINDAIALKTADVSISLRGATTAATDTAQIVLMDAHFEQLLTLIQLVEELHKNLNLNFNIAMALSLVSAAGVLFFHAGFVIVEILFAGQFITGIGIASMPLLKQQKS